MHRAGEGADASFRHHLSISDAKVDMLLSQIDPDWSRERVTEFSAGPTTAGAKRSVETTGTDCIARLERSALINAASGVMTDLAIYPLALDIDANEARILAAMDESALLTRSRGPYSPDNLPPEAVEMIQWAALRWSTKPERPEFTIEGGGPWPVLVMTLPVSRVLVRYVVSEAAPPVYQPDPGNVTLSGDITLMLRFLVNSLRVAGRKLGGEPPIALTLSYPEDPDYEERVASVQGEFQHVIPPVVATVEVDRSHFSPKQRAAHDEALRSVAYSPHSHINNGRP